MKSRLIDLDAAKEALKPYLGEYLQEHGINTDKNFQCLNPKHNDSSPSMTCKQIPDNAFCMGCGATVDIFQAAHHLEGKPIKGKEYVEENVMFLAEKYGVQVQLQDLTPEEVYEYRTYSAYKLAAQLISDPDFGDYTQADKQIAERKWDKNKCSKWGIGTVDYSEFKATMKSSGYEPGFLSGIDLDRSNLFNNNNLLFTVYDDFGRPVGFSAKNLKFNKDDPKSGPKYMNTKGTGLECAIFKKGSRLYGFDIAKDAASPLYIFEGQADVITARHNGLMNCCCTLGTAMTDHHLMLLKKHGLFNIVLVFDGDQAGELAVQKAVDEKFAKEKDFRIKLCEMPDGEDPDSLIRTKGIAEFGRLKRWTAFEWRMQRFMEEESENEDLEEEKKTEIAEKMAQIIVSEKSHIRQEEMAKQVAKTTGYDHGCIISEVKRLRNEKEAEVQDRKRNAIEALMKDVRHNPDEAELALAQAMSSIQDINRSVQGENTGSAILNKMMSQKEADEAKTGEFAGFFMKPEGLGGIAARLDDDWRSDNLIYIGGGEQAGKTTFCSQMAYEIASDERNDAMCIYHSIDDASKFPTYKWVCNGTGNTRLKLNHVSSPKYWMGQEGHKWVAAEREVGYKDITKLMQEERLIVVDSSDGQSITYAEGLVKYYREKYPQRNIVLFVDNFHKLPDYAEIQGHERVKRLSNHLKNMAVANHITIVSTVEYKKLPAGEKPDNQAIAESRALAYDATVILHLYNNLHHSNEDEAILIHKDDYGNTLPRIWVKFGKNKVSGYEGREFVDLFGYAGQVRAVDLEMAVKDQQERMAFLKENKPNSF